MLLPNTFHDYRRWAPEFYGSCLFNQLVNSTAKEVWVPIILFPIIHPQIPNLEKSRILKMVDEAHKRDMYVILDWVANHSSWDNVWMEDHKDYYTGGKDGNIVPPVADWSDVADLNYDNPEMRRAMIDAMRYWITETGIDGFRCDVGMMVPDDFWTDCIAELKK